MHPKIFELVSNRKTFDEYIYTPVLDAMRIHEERKNDPRIQKYLEKIGIQDLPPPLSEGNKFVLFRNVANLNYETLRFMILTEPLDNWQPVILEYLGDRFSNRNQNKLYLGKISLYKGEDKNRQSIFQNKVLIDINKSNQQTIDEVYTLSGQSLIEFHHNKFLERFSFMENGIYDMSEWLRRHGPAAKDYYKKVLALFLQNAVMFENFFPGDDESFFTTNIVLPALMEIEKEIGLKPLIVALSPTDIEESKFWLSYTSDFLN